MDREVSPPPLKRRKLAAIDESDESTIREDIPSGTAQTPHMSPAARPLTNTTLKAIRIFSWNINGLQPFIPASAAPITSYFKPLRQDGAAALDHGAANLLRAFLARHDWPEVLLLQELKISPTSESRLASALVSTLNTSMGPKDEVTPERSYTVEFVLPRDKYNAAAFQGKLYGVGTILRTDFARRYVTRLRNVDWDLEGRVSIVETCRSDSPSRGRGEDMVRPLALVNVYAVNGTSAPYKSPQTGKVVGTRHNHKLAFHTRLRDECLLLESRGFNVVIAGDLNIARGFLDGHPNLRTYPAQHCRNRADFNAKLFGAEDNKRAQAYLEDTNKSDKRKEPSFDGVDVFRALHGAERRYTYHPRTKTWGASGDRVDMIIVSRQLWEGRQVTRTGICDSPQERGPSDHVPLWVEVALNKCTASSRGTTFSAPASPERS
jgi:exonuclease III